jgi:hypothetical protein
MARFKWGNHDDVLNFGKKTLSENIRLVTTRCPYGTTGYRNDVDMALSIIARLGNHSDRKSASDLVTSTLTELSSSDNLNDWQKNEISKIWYIFEYHNLEADNGY